MAFNGSGVFNRLYNWVDDRDSSIPITASRMDDEMDGMATGLSTAITKDGQTTITANLPMAGFRHTGVGNASARTDYAAAGQIQDGSLVFAVSGGAADVQTLSPSPAITAYTDGMLFNFEAGFTNTGAATLNISGVGAQSIVLPNGNALPAGAITAGRFYTVIYDLTNTNWILFGSSVVDDIEIISSNTTDDVFSITADSITTASAVSISSNSSSTSIRNLVEIINDNSAATGAFCLHVRQDAAKQAVVIDQNADSSALFIDSESLTANIINIHADTTTSGAAINISNADSLTSGNIINLVSNSADTSARDLVDIHNDNALATSARCLHLVQDSDATALAINQNADGFAIEIGSTATTSATLSITASSTTTGNIINVPAANGLTTGSILNLVSDSSSGSTRTLVNIVNDNTSATVTKCLTLQQDASGATADCLRIDNNGNARSIVVVGDSTTTESCLFVTADALTTGKIAHFISDSSSASTRELVTIHNDNSSATGTRCLELIQDAVIGTFRITANGAASPPAVDINTAGDGIDVNTTDTAGWPLVLVADSASYAQTMCRMDSARTATTGFDFMRCRSDYDGTPDTEFVFQGDGNGLCDGSFTGGGADYAEYFEWLDGNPNNEDRRGIAVELVGDKIRPATDPSTVFGVISGNPSMVGDAAWNKWAGKYLRDDYGSYIMEDYEVWSWHDEDGKLVNYAYDRVPDGAQVPDEKEIVVQQRRKLNPDFDPSAEYVKRAERQEWDCVGLMGKLRIRKGQVTGPRWIKMRDISGYIEEWLVR